MKQWMNRAISLLLVTVMLVGFLPAAAPQAEAASKEYWNWRQKDPAWANKLMGHSKATVGGYGCLTVSLAMLLEMSGQTKYNFDPGVFTDQMNQVGAYTSSGAFRDYNLIRKLYPDFRYTGRDITYKSMGSKASEVRTVKELCDAGKYVMASVKGKYVNGSHFVAIRGVENGEIIMMDPGAFMKSNHLHDSYSSISRLIIFEAPEKNTGCKHNWGYVMEGGIPVYGVCTKCGARHDHMATLDRSRAGIYRVKDKEPGALCFTQPYPETGFEPMSDGELLVAGTVRNATNNLWHCSGGDYPFFYRPVDLEFVRAIEPIPAEVTAKDGLWMNRNPGAGSGIVVMPAGAQILVHPERTAANGWLYVEYGGHEGYASGNLIRIPDTDRINLTADSFAVTMQRGKTPSLRHFIISGAPILYVNVRLDGTNFVMENPDVWHYELKNIQNNKRWKSLTPGQHTMTVTAMDMTGSARTVDIPVTVQGSAVKVCPKPTVTYEDRLGGKTIIITGQQPEDYINLWLNGEARTGGYGRVEYNVDCDTDVRAYAIRSGMDASESVRCSVTVPKMREPVFESYEDENGVNVVLKSPDGGEILYEYGKVSADSIGEGYDGPIVLSESGYVSAMVAMSSGRRESEVVSQYFEVHKPQPPKVTVETRENGKVSLGDPVVISWEPVAGALSYSVEICDELHFYPFPLEGHYDLKETAYTFTPSAENGPGKYRVYVKACSSVLGDSEPAEAEFELVRPSVVRFVDEDENGKEILLSQQEIPYGDPAVEPDPAPEREGHYFLRWDRDFSHVTHDLTVRPVYKPITYTVTFKDHAGMILDVQNVTYHQSAIVPDSTALNGPSDGYQFVGWSITAESAKSKCDLEHIDSNMIAQAMFTWKDQTKPVRISALDAQYDASNRHGHYTVTVKVENSDYDFTRAILRVALKTTAPDGTQKVVDTASQGVSLRKGPAAETYTFTMNYPGTAALAEAVVVGYEYDTLTGSAYSEAVTAEVQCVTDYTYGPYSDWSADDPRSNPGWSEQDGVLYDDKGNPVEVETKTVYRSREQEKTTSTSDTLAGWELEPGSASTAYGDWRNVGWTRNNPGNTDTVRVTDTKTVVDSHGYTDYYYYHYWGVGSDGQIYSSYGNGVWKKKEEIYSRTLLPKGPKPDGRQAYEKRVSGMHGTHWWRDSGRDRHVPDSTHQEWYYQTRTSYPVYTFTRWPAWNDSAWQDTPIRKTDTNEVETAVRYRYHVRNKAEVGPMDKTLEDTSGTKYTFTNKAGVLPEGDFGYVPQALPAASELDLTGRIATVMVYKGKNVDPNESQIQYVGQVTLEPGNEFEVSFIPKSGEPTHDTGDFIVAMSVEGSVGLINVGRVPAPRRQFTVTYLDADGSVIESRQVPEGSSSTAPAAPVKEGHTFVTWSETGTNVHSDMNIMAIYTPKTYSVVFVDWINRQVYSYASVYGTSLDELAQQIGIPAAEGHTFTGWAYEPGTVVTGNMAISANYTPDTYLVSFYSGDTLVEEQQVAYGESAVLPTAPVQDNKVFLGWSTDAEWWRVKSDLRVDALFAYADTAMAPESELLLEEGVTRIVLTAQEGAEIYYTLDGSEPDPAAAAEEEPMTAFAEPVPGADAADEGTAEGTTKRYAGPFTVAEGTPVRAIAVMPEKNDSAVIEVPFEYDDKAEKTDTGFIEISTYQVPVTPGGQITLNVNLGRNPGLVSYLFDVRCDRRVFSIADKAAAPAAEGAAAPGIRPGEVSGAGTFLYGENTAGWQILWYSEKPSAAGGSLFSITLKFADNAKEGVYPIRLSYSPANTVTGEDLVLPDEEFDVDFGSEDGQVQVLGDVNGDGRITTADVILIARYVIDEELFSSKQTAAADVNCDGKVTAADVIRLARYLIGLAEIGGAEIK